MTLSNPSPAERIVAHEQKIAENIQKIEVNEQRIVTKEVEITALFAEKTVLEGKKLPLYKRLLRDDSLNIERDVNNQSILSAQEDNVELKKDTFALKLETSSERELLIQTELDEQALLQEKITDKEGAKNRSEERLRRLETYNAPNPARAAVQAENIARERTVLARRESDLADANRAAIAAQTATQARDSKITNDITTSCPLTCDATKLSVKSNNGGRNYTLMANESDQPIKTLHVISLSQKALENTPKKNLNSSGISIISAYLEGKCEKGLAQSSPLSKEQFKLERETSGEYCPVIKVHKDDIKLTLPGTASEPLMFNIFCPAPPTGLVTWGYLFRDIIFPKYRTPPIKYIIESMGCDKSYELKSQVFAHQKIKLELELGITYKKTEKIEVMSGWKFNPEVNNLVEDYNKGHRTVELGNWLFTMDLKGKVDSTNLAYQLQSLNPADCLSALRTAINGFIFLFDIIRICTNDNIGSNITGVEYLADKIIDNKVDAVDEKGKASAEGPTGSISIVYPKMALNLTYENCEAEGKNILGHATSVAVKFSPLIGVTSKVDILGALIKIASNALIPGASTGGKAFVKFVWPIVKELMSSDGISTQSIDENNKDYYLSAGISLIMDIGANISCEGKFTHIKDASHLGLADVEPETPPENKGAVTTTDSTALEIKLEGKVWVKGKVWVVEFEAGLILAIGGASAPGAAKMEYKVNLSQIDDKIMVEGQFEWNGLAIFFQSYKTIAVKSKDNDETGKSDLIDDFGDPIPENTESETSQTLQEVDTRKQWVLIEPGKTPDTPDKIPLNDYLFSFTEPVKKAFRFFRSSL